MAGRLESKLSPVGTIATHMSELIHTTRDVQVTEIPSGYRGVLPANSQVRLMQALGGNFTVITTDGAMVRIAASDADAIGLEPAAAQASQPTGEFSEQMVWNELRTVYDPEIPVNIVDLGLVYTCAASDVEGGKKV